MDFYGLLMDFDGFLWILMDFYWLLMDFYGLLIDFYGLLMVFYGLLMVCYGFLMGFLWIFDWFLLIVDGFLWIFDGFLWIFDGFESMFMGICCGFRWILKFMFGWPINGMTASDLWISGSWPVIIPMWFFNASGDILQFFMAYWYGVWRSFGWRLLWLFEFVTPSSLNLDPGPKCLQFSSSWIWC